jgi:hypothetical protein
VINRGCNPENETCNGGCSYPPDPGEVDGEETTTECAPLYCTDCCGSEDCCPTTTTTPVPCYFCQYDWWPGDGDVYFWRLLENCLNPESCLCDDPPAEPGEYAGQTVQRDCIPIGQTLAPEVMLAESTSTTPRPLITPEARAMLAIIKERIRLPCAHLGSELETRSSCGCGKSSLRHSCGILGECRVYAPRATDQIAQCVECPHYEAPHG